MASKACCTIPPVVSEDDFQRAGTFSALDGMRTYVTGNTSSKTGVLVIYDIFGLDFPQTQQGVDIIASSTPALVVVPDLFHGKPMEIKNFPPDTPEKQAALGAFFGGPANPANNVETVRGLVPKLKAAYPSVERWALVGYCWGGKIVTLLSAGDEFVAGAQIHPAMLDPTDAEKLKIPNFCLATKDEDAAATEKFKENVEKNEAIKDKSKILRWDGTFHGFMAARANLKDKENLEYYQKGYKTLVHWLKEVL
ncbi:dienelactone hydrolase [Pyronema omphalodes]|nr:dienelactone hydrolase [Pyronema omphalodes]